MKLAYQFVIQEVAGSYMAVAVGPNAEDFKDMIKLNGTAKHIFTCLQQKKGVEEIVMSMSDVYEVSEPEARKSVESFVSQLRKAGVLVD